MFKTLGIIIVVAIILFGIWALWRYFSGMYKTARYVEDLTNVYESLVTEADKRPNDLERTPKEGDTT